MSETEDERTLEFLHFYQNLKFQETGSDEIVIARCKRMQLLMNNLQSRQHMDRYASDWLLNRDIEKYCEIIDDVNGINNYAGYVSALSSRATKPATECKKWQSSLRKTDKFKLVVMESNSNVTTEREKSDQTILREIASKLQIHKNELKSPNSSGSTHPHLFLNIIEPKPEVPSPQTMGFLHPARSFHSTCSPPENNSIINVRNKNEVPKEKEPTNNGFRTASTEMKIQNIKKHQNQNNIYQNRENIAIKRSLGARPRSVNSKFVPPVNRQNETIEQPMNITESKNIEDDRLKNLDPKLIELIRNEIMDHGHPITWDDISGLDFAKKTIQEIVVWPLLRPDIFTGLRRPPKGILLFGPPGTGKTLIGKCIASQSSSTFFSISASSLTSKWIGESEKLVRTLFTVARCHQPAVIFIDEIDSLLSQRSETEHESSRRIKTEFLVQLDGATTDDDDRILVIGATNRPQELDEAARRRLVKRLYIPLPEFTARHQIVERLMSTEKNDLTPDNVEEIAKLTDGYSGADMNNLCKEASLGPIRSIDFRMISSIDSQAVRPVTLADFHDALKVVRPSVSPSDLNQYLDWDKIYGSRGC